MAQNAPAFLGALPVVTSNSAPNIGKLNRYSAAGGSLALTLPALSSVGVGATLMIQKDESDTSPNTISIACAGSDTLDSGNTSVTLRVPGSQRTFQAVQVSSVKYWKVIYGHDPLASLDKRYPRASVVAPLATGVAATDRANLLQALADCPSGGRLFIPDGTYVIDQPIVVTKSVSIEGNSMTETWKPQGQSGALNHPVAPGVSGVVIQQSGAGLDVLQLTGSAITVNLKNLGLTWSSSLLNQNTGHGVNAKPSLTNPAGGHDSGLFGCTWENVTVYGHDGNHYAFDIQNSMYNTYEHLHGYGGGGMRIDCDSFYGNYGNTVIIEPYMETLNAGTADAYRLTARTEYANTGVLNLLTFIRPQANVTSAAATAQVQKAWNNRAGTAKPTYTHLIDPDMEVTGGWAGSIDFGGAGGGTVVTPGGLLTSYPTGGFDTAEKGYRKFTSTANFFVPEGVYSFRYRVTGAGGGGAGGGTASSGVNQVGGGGGGAGMVCEGTYTCVPRQTIAMTVSPGGTGGTGGAAGGSPGVKGNDAGTTKIGEDVKAIGGGGGAPGLASSSVTAAGGWYGRGGSTQMPNTPGFGGNGQNPNGITGVQMPPGVVGGGGGGASNNPYNLGGGGGSAATSTWPAFAHTGGGNANASSTATGINGTTATTPGCGGGGGGAGTQTGAGGNGGDGAPGQIEIWW